MAVDMEYIKGTKEFVRLKLTAEAPEFVFVADEWDGHVAFCSYNEDFDADTADWYDATISTIDDVHYVFIMIGKGTDADLDIDRYKVFFRPVSKSGNYEEPVVEILGTVRMKVG